VGEGRIALLASTMRWLWTGAFEGGGPQLSLLRQDLRNWNEWPSRRFEEDAAGGPRPRGRRIRSRAARWMMPARRGGRSPVQTRGDGFVAAGTDRARADAGGVPNGPQPGALTRDLFEGDLDTVPRRLARQPRASSWQTIYQWRAAWPGWCGQRGAGIFGAVGPGGVPSVREVRPGRRAAGARLDRG